MKFQLRPALVVFGLLTVITGVVYPLTVTVVGQGLFPHAANGSVIPGGGSELIGQPFDAPHYFWGRPSAIAPFTSNSAASTGSNQGPTNPDLLKAIGERKTASGWTMASRAPWIQRTGGLRSRSTIPVVSKTFGARVLRMPRVPGANPGQFSDGV